MVPALGLVEKVRSVEVLIIQDKGQSYSEKIQNIKPIVSIERSWFIKNIHRVTGAIND
jgi:hypothetical protein